MFSQKRGSRKRLKSIFKLALFDHPLGKHNLLNTVHNNTQKVSDILNINFDSNVRKTTTTHITAMNCSQFYFLEEISRISPRRSRIQWIDYAVLSLAMIFVCGGCLLALDMASAHSSGSQSFTHHASNVISEWHPVVFQKLSTGLMLLSASIFNSALIVGFVHLLRSMDRRLSRARQRQWQQQLQLARQAPKKEATASCVRQAEQKSQFSGFLINPILR